MTAWIDWKGRIRHLIAGSFILLLVVLFVALLSSRPSWQSLPADEAVLRLSFTHSGVRDCRERTAEELAKLPPNMRNRKLCDRTRSSVWIEMEIDGKTVVARDLHPSGIAGSGPSRMYQRFNLPAGQHHLVVRMRDDPAARGFTQKAAFEIDLAPGQNIAVDFNGTTGQFFLH